MYSYVVIEEAESGEFSRLERRRFGEFSEVTEESEFQNPAPVTKEINPSRRFKLRLKLRAASF